MLRKIIIGVVAMGVVGFVMLQVIAFSAPAFARTNPPVTYEIEWDSPETEQLVRDACFDCHSHETVWPWYSYVVPTGLIVPHHVNEGRELLNFSTGEGREFEAEHMIEHVENRSMPLPPYPAMHPEAQLDDAEIQQIIAGIMATFGSGSGQGNVTD